MFWGFVLLAILGALAWAFSKGGDLKQNRIESRKLQEQADALRRARERARLLESDPEYRDRVRDKFTR